MGNQEDAPERLFQPPPNRKQTRRRLNSDLSDNSSGRGPLPSVESDRPHSPSSIRSGSSVPSPREPVASLHERSSSVDEDVEAVIDQEELDAEEERRRFHRRRRLLSPVSESTTPDSMSSNSLPVLVSLPPSEATSPTESVDSGRWDSDDDVEVMSMNSVDHHLPLKRKNSFVPESIKRLSVLNIDALEEEGSKPSCCLQCGSCVRRAVNDTSFSRAFWMFYMIIYVVSQLFVIPFRAVFYELGEDFLWPWHVIEGILEITLVCDCVVRSLRPFRIREKKIDDFRRTCSRYWIPSRAGWPALIDIAFLMPWYLIGLFVGYRYFSFLKFIRIVWLLLRLWDLFTYFQSFFQRRLSVSPTYVKIAKGGIFVWVLAHLASCGFVLIVTLTVNPADARKWSMSYDLVDPASSVAFRYFLALYWALVTMTGYGGTMPVTDTQVLYSIIVVAVGVGVYVTIIGIVGALATNLNVARSAFREKLDTINDYMKYRRVDGKSQRDIRKYYHYLWDSRKGLDENKIVTQLPTFLRASVAIELHLEALKTFHLFKNVKDDSFLREILLHLSPAVSYPHSFIIRQGETGNEMYFLSKGEAKVYVNSKEVWQFHPGDFFGEIALLKKMRRTASVKSTTFCDLFVLKKKDFEEIMAHFPTEAEIVRQTAEDRLRKTNEGKKQQKMQEREEERKKAAEDRKRDLLKKLNEAQLLKHKLHLRKRGGRRRGSRRALKRNEILEKLREV